MALHDTLEQEKIGGINAFRDKASLDITFEYSPALLYRVEFNSGVILWNSIGISNRISLDHERSLGEGSL